MLPILSQILPNARHGFERWQVVPPARFA